MLWMPLWSLKLNGYVWQVGRCQQAFKSHTSPVKIQRCRRLDLSVRAEERKGIDFQPKPQSVRLLDCIPVLPKMHSHSRFSSSNLHVGGTKEATSFHWQPLLASILHYFSTAESFSRTRRMLFVSFSLFSRSL